MLVVGLAIDNQTLVWASIAASVCAALVLAAAVMRRRQLDLAEPATVSSSAASGSSTTSGTTAELAHGRHHSGEAAIPVDPSVPSGISELPPAVAEQPVSYPDPPDEPPEEDVSATDALRIIDLRDEVLVVDGRPRYHLADCRHLTGRETVGLPISEARESGFTPCAWCPPDSRLAETARGTGAP